MLTHSKCPHCGHLDEHDLESGDDARLPSDRVPVGEDPVGPFETCCAGCGATYAVSWTVHEQPLVATYDRIDIAAVKKEGAAVAKGIRKFLRRKDRETPPPVSCAGCGREFGETLGYPDPLPREGVCAVCSQEMKRILARRSS